MDHVVELAYAHSTLAYPVFPGLDRQTSRFRPLDLPPEVVCLPSQKVALPEDATKELIRVTGEIPSLEQNGCLLFRRSTSSPARHRRFTWIRENLVLALILMVRLFAV